MNYFAIDISSFWYEWYRGREANIFYSGLAHQILSVEMMKVIENENAGFFPNSDDVHHRKRCFSTAMWDEKNPAKLQKS